MSLRRVAGVLDTDRGRRTARGVASWCLKGRRLRALCSLGGVGGGELGGSESWLEDAMAIVPLGAGRQDVRLEAEQTVLKRVGYTRVSRNGVVCRKDDQ